MSLDTPVCPSFDLIINTPTRSSQVGHDVSHRGWQIDRGGQPQPQFSMGKGADGWAPWGTSIPIAKELCNSMNLRTRNRDHITHPGSTSSQLVDES
jgi:2-keto-4-pentenoate hydratase/2-oxohepta-3-ene-1,7-dioic acid hydratase in catechol pathway